jgi:hypothetical protein
MKVLTKEEVLQIAATSEAASNLMRQFYPEFFAPIPVPVENAIDLSNLSFRNRQFFLGNTFLGSINASPFYIYTNKAILVDSYYKATVEIVNNRYMVVFEKK